MKLHRSVVALSAAAALTLGLPGAAYAHAGHGHTTPKVSSAQQHKVKAVNAAKAAKAKAAAAAKREAARKKAAEARARFTFPGKVASVGATGLQITRKERGHVVTRDFVLSPSAVVKRDGVRITLADLLPGDHVVAKGRRVGSELVVDRMNVERRADAPAPVVPDTATATILI